MKTALEILRQTHEELSKPNPADWKSFDTIMKDGTGEAMLKAMEDYADQFRQPYVSGSLPIRIKSVKKLKRGDVFLWRSGITGRYEIHTFHSDAGYGAKTFTDYNEKDGSSILVNYSGICGVLEGNDR